MITILDINERLPDIEVFLEPTSFHRDEKNNWIVDTFRHYYEGKPDDEVEEYIQSNYESICRLMCRYSDFETLENCDEEL